MPRELVIAFYAVNTIDLKVAITRAEAEILTILESLYLFFYLNRIAAVSYSSLIDI